MEPVPTWLDHLKTLAAAETVRLEALGREGLEDLLTIRDGQFFRLALVLAHAARVRNFSPGILMDRFIRQALEAYAGLFDRILKRLRHHKAASRVFSAAQIKAGDEAALASNLCAQICFRDLSLPEKAQCHADVGLAGL